MNTIESQEKMQQERTEREKLKVGDDAALEAGGDVWIDKVKRILEKEVLVGRFHSVPYSKETGAPLGYSRYRLRGPATPEELDDWKARLSAGDLQK